MTTETEQEARNDYISRETIAAIPDELVSLFEYQVLAALEDVSLGMPFVGLQYFKNRIVPERIWHRASQVMAHVIVSKMIASGKLDISEQVDSKDSDRKVTTVKKGTGI